MTTQGPAIITPKQALPAARTENQFRDSLRWLIVFRVLQRSRIYTAFIALFWAQASFSISQIMLLILINMASCGLLELPSGWFADRYGYRLSLILGSGALTIAYFLFAYSQVYWVQVTGSALIGIGQLCFGTDSSMAYNTHKSLGLSSDSYEEYESKCQRYGYGAQAITIAIGTIIAYTLELHVIVWISAGVWASSGILAWWKLVEPQVSHQQRPSFWTTFRSLPKRLELLTLMSFSAALIALTTVIWWLRPLYFADVQIAGHYLSPSFYGLAAIVYLIVFGYATRLGVRVFRALGPRKGFLVTLSPVYVSAGLLCLPTGWWSLLLFIGPGGAQAMFIAPLTRATHDLAASHERATITSCFGLIVLGFTSLFTWFAQLSMANEAQPLQAGMFTATMISSVFGIIAFWVYTRISRHSEQPT